MSGLGDVPGRVQVFIGEYGRRGYGAARAVIDADEVLAEPLVGVLRFFLEESWLNLQHPALVSLACEAVGGARSAPDGVSAALVLLTGAADVHDDVIDKSKSKGGKPTVFGKFGADFAILAGDILLLKALTQLENALQPFPPQTRQAIRSIIEHSCVEMASATAKERLYKGDFTLDPNLYREIIYAKGAILDGFARIGATIGGGKRREIAVLGHFGRTLSILMSMRNEFLDMRTATELKNRAVNEVLPLPILYALQDGSVKDKSRGLLNGRITNKSTESIARLALSSKLVQGLKEEMLLTAKEEEKRLSALNGDVSKFKMLLQLPLHLVEEATS